MMKYYSFVGTSQVGMALHTQAQDLGITLIRVKVSDVAARTGEEGESDDKKKQTGTMDK